MYDFEKYENLIKQRLSNYRYVHSMNVAKRAVELAEIYGADEEKCYLAGVLHDITKEVPYDEQEKIILNAGITLTDLEKSNKKVYHQMSGMAYCKNILGITDEQVLSGIRYHTTGKADMTDFEMIIYLADLTSAERNYKDFEYTRDLTDKSLIKAMIYATDFIINDLTAKNLPIHPDTIQCNNWAKEKDSILEGTK